MNNLFWLTDAQVERLRQFFPKSHGKPRGDDRRVLSGIIFINRNGLRWCDAPREYGPPKTLYNRWKRWGDMGVFARMMEGLASAGTEQKTVMIDVSGHAPLVRVCPRKYLKAHRTASSLRAKKGGPTTSAGV
jgi:transposase